MRTKNYVYIPILILLSLFLVDKISLLPVIEDCCIQRGLEIFFTSSKNNEFPAEERVKKAFGQNKKVVYSFGSSLAYGFYFNKSKEYLTATKKQPLEIQNKIRDWEIIHFGIPGSTVVSHYVRLEQMLERGLKPNLILVELAPNSFNANSPWYTAEIVNAIPLDFALKHFSEIPLAHFRKILISRIFVLSNKKLGRPIETYNLLHGYFQKFIYDYGKQEEQQTSPKSFRVGEETVASAFLSQSLLQVLKLNFTNYKVAPDLAVYAHLLLAKAKKEKIPILFWFPALHPLARNAISETNTPSSWEAFLKDSPEISSEYIDMNYPENFCDEFMDPMHMGVSCFAKSFPRFLENIDHE